jgi:hypothetical protein
VSLSSTTGNESACLRSCLLLKESPLFRGLRVLVWIPLFLTCWVGFGQVTPRVRTPYPSALPPVDGVSIAALTGRLSAGIPIGTIPGDIPVPLVYRVNGSPVSQVVGGFGAPCIDGQPGGNSGNTQAWTMRAIATKDRPASGGLHFGYILANKILPVGSEPTWWVLEK